MNSPQIIIDTIKFIDLATLKTVKRIDVNDPILINQWDGITFGDHIKLAPISKLEVLVDNLKFIEKNCYIGWYRGNIRFFLQRDKTLYSFVITPFSDNVFEIITKNPIHVVFKGTDKLYSNYSKAEPLDFSENNLYCNIYYKENAIDILDKDLSVKLPILVKHINILKKIIEDTYFYKVCLVTTTCDTGRICEPYYFQTKENALKEFKHLLKTAKQMAKDADYSVQEEYDEYFSAYNEEFYSDENIELYIEKFKFED